MASFERTFSVLSLIIFIMIEDIIDFFFLLIHPNDYMKMRLLIVLLLP